MPWDKKGKRIHDGLIKGMYEQLKKDMIAFYELFPDFPPHQIELQVVGALPFSSSSELFCDFCASETITKG